MVVALVVHGPVSACARKSSNGYSPFQLCAFAAPFCPSDHVCTIHMSIHLDLCPSSCRGRERSFPLRCGVQVPLGVQVTNGRLPLVHDSSLVAFDRCLEMWSPASSSTRALAIGLANVVSLRAVNWRRMSEDYQTISRTGSVLRWG